IVEQWLCSREGERMADGIQQVAPRGLALGMGLNSQDIERRQRIVGLDAADLIRIKSVRDLIVRNVEELTNVFFNYLSGLDEARQLISNRQLVDQARQMKREHLLAMVQAEYGAEYMGQRVTLGAMYGKAGIEARVFLAAFYQLVRAIGAIVMRHFERSSSEGFETFMSLEKVAFLDVSLIVDALIFERERIIRQQQEAIRELSTPVLQLRERLLLLPIIGVIDTHRARLITESLLLSIRNNRAKVVVMDITGVATIDSKVANHL